MAATALKEVGRKHLLLSQGRTIRQFGLLPVPCSKAASVLCHPISRIQHKYFSSQAATVNFQSLSEELGGTFGSILLEKMNKHSVAFSFTHSSNNLQENLERLTVPTVTARERKDLGKEPGQLSPIYEIAEKAADLLEQIQGVRRFYLHG